MSVYFCIPNRDDDLLEVSDTYYYVSDLVTDAEEIDLAQSKFHNYVKRGEFRQITEVFDAFFSVARHNEEIDPGLRIRIFESLAIGLNNFLAALRIHIGEVAAAETLTEELTTTSAKHLSMLLMYIYLLTRIAHHLECYAVKKTKSLNTTQKTPLKKAVEQQSGDYVLNFWNSCDGRMRLLRLLYNIVTLNAAKATTASARAGIKFLSTPHVINEQLTNSIIKILMKTLENPEASRSGGRNILVAVFHVIRAMCINWDQSRVLARHLIDLAPRLEFFQQQGVTNFPFIDVIPLVQVKDEMEPLLASMVACIGNFDMDSFVTKGEVSARAFSLFISTLAEKYPRLLFKNIAYIVPFLSFDPPSLRNSVLTAFTEIVTKCLDNEQRRLSEGLNLNIAKQKRTMLIKLQDHIVDTSALVRTRALNLWAKLAMKRTIPAECFRLLLLQMAGDRLRDNSIMVRKAAITLLTTALTYNTFSSNLCYNHCFFELSELRKRQKEVAAKNPEFNIVREVTKRYDAIENNIKQVLKLCLDEFIASENFPTSQLVKRRASVAALNGSRVDESELDEADNQNGAFGANTQEVLDMYYIAVMIMEGETRVEGCLAFLKMAMRQNEENFARDMDVDETVEKLSESIRELILQQGVAHNIRDDDQALIEEDRVTDFSHELAEVQERIARCLDKLLFVSQMEQCLPKASYCLKHGQASEMPEMIRFICECCKFKVRGASDELKKVFHLIWRKDNTITELIIDAGYDALFSKNSDPDIAGRRTALNLMEIMKDSTDEERISLDETLMKIVSLKGLSDEVLRSFWSAAEYQPPVESTESLSRRIVGLRLLAIVARAQKERIRPDLSRLTRIYRTREQIIRIEVLRIVTALSSINEGNDLEGQPKTVFKIPSSDKLIKSMYAFLITELNSEEHDLWIPHCRQVVEVIYAICARPYVTISSLFSRMVRVAKRSVHQQNLVAAELRRSVEALEALRSTAHDQSANLEVNMSSLSVATNASINEADFDNVDGGAVMQMTNTTQFTALNGAANDHAEVIVTVENDGGPVPPADEQPPLKEDPAVLRARVKHLKRMLTRGASRWELSVARLLYFVGEVTLKFLTYLEVVFTRQIKTALEAIHEVRLMEDDERMTLKLTKFDMERDTPLVQFERDSIRQRGFFEKADREDERIGLTAISEEEKLQIKLQKILDQDIFHPSTINGRILPFVEMILQNHETVSECVKEAAVGCLAKLMLVNRKCCSEFLPLFFQFYEGGSVRLRNNMIIMMTDLCFRFPNTFNEFNDEYIKKIRDKNSGIRYTCLLVLSHMLLNDLIKVSMRISELAPCLCDEDKKICALARGFFTELSKKHNVLYNTLPDIISRLTTNKELGPKKFEEVMKFLLQFVVKDQHKEALIDKICQRFQILKTHHSAEEDEALPEALAFCIAQIPLNERCFRRLVDNLRNYKDFLIQPTVYKHFYSSIVAFKKASAKSGELRVQIEEFEKTVIECQGK